MKKQIKCFEEEIEKGVSYTVMDAGLRVVEIKSITGTVDKCGELDEYFRYKKRRDRNETSRRYGIIQAFQKNTILPPVDLNLYRGEYYVVDGNRRVSAAIEMGMSYIDANVTEYINSDNALDMSGAFHRRRFEQKTGIRNLILSYEYGYEFLRREAEDYGGDEGTPAGSASWYSQVFLPRCKMIEKSVLPVQYRNLRTGDIYVLIGEFYRNFLGGIPAHVNYKTIISGYLFAHGLHPRRRLRSYIYRLFARLLLGNLKVG